MPCRAAPPFRRRLVPFARPERPETSLRQNKDAILNLSRRGMETMQLGATRFVAGLLLRVSTVWSAEVYPRVPRNPWYRA
jgi:hypothetical protein